MGNLHQNSYVLNRFTNCLTTEDGAEPGVYQDDHLQGRRGHPETKDIVAVGQGKLVTKAGLFQIYNALSEGGRPMLVEDGGREVAGAKPLPWPRSDGSWHWQKPRALPSDGVQQWHHGEEPHAPYCSC